MKILLATYWRLPHLGGVWPLMVNMKEKLEALGHEVDVFGNSEDESVFHMPFSGRVFYKEAVRPFLEKKISPELYPVLHSSSWLSHFEMNTLCMELAAAYFGLEQYDVIHTQDVLATRSFRRVKSPRTGLVASLHGSVAHEIKLHLVENNVNLEESLIWRFQSAIEHLGATSSDITIASSQWLKRLLTTEYSVPEHHVEVFQYGYATGDFYAKMASSATPIYKPPGKKVIIFTGRLIPIKGLSLLIEAVGLLRTVRDDFVCWIVGEGDQEAELKKQCMELGLLETVQFLGRRNDVPYLLAQSDIFVQPSYVDNQPLSLIEAQLAGKPSVVSDATGVPEMVEHGRTGLIFPSGNSQQLFTHLYTLLENTSMREAMGREAGQWGAVHWSMDLMVQRLLDVYGRAIAKAAQA
ncbi:glycosyltransferase family 4 protein [Paenibacillus chitinolyticus]|uniref:glycosyltransferase family 4 protein n=1 Tax=Paenibacillus chitinolyticus TaxID=79263 RepID=UPI00366A97A6